MARLQIEMDLDNAAFEENGRDEEIARILKRLAGRIKLHGVGNYGLFDLNGNPVGDAVLHDA